MPSEDDTSYPQRRSAIVEMAGLPAGAACARPCKAIHSHATGLWGSAIHAEFCRSRLDTLVGVPIISSLLIGLIGVLGKRDGYKRDSLLHKLWLKLGPEPPHFPKRTSLAVCSSYRVAFRCARRGSAQLGL